MTEPLGAELPHGTRFIGPEAGAVAAWGPGDHPEDADLSRCVACGLCLPHCPTYRLTGEESASPRGRIAAMRTIAEGRALPDDTFATFVDLCLACRACEDVCPSHVPFGRMIEAARAQVEPLRTRRALLVRWLGLDVALPRRRVLSLLRTLTPAARPFLPRRVRGLVPRGAAGPRVPVVTEPLGEPKGVVAVLTGCVQDQWFREVNRATARVLARNGWRVLAPRTQVCCGALHAHNGRPKTARRLARRNLRALGSADHIVVNAAGCGAHMKDYAEVLGTEEAAGLAAKVRDLMEFLAEHGVEPPGAGAGVDVVAYHDACHALRAQHVRAQPREVLRTIPGLELVEIENGDRCCGAAGMYNVLQPEMADDLRRLITAGVAATGASVVASANPGCVMQLAAGLASAGVAVDVVHPVELLDRAYALG